MLVFQHLWWNLAHTIYQETCETPYDRLNPPYLSLVNNVGVQEL